jgi:3-methyladenine DNA glycosylase AlkD
MTYEEIIKDLRSQKNPKNIAGMASFGINSKGTLGISIPYLRNLAKKIGKDHNLAGKLWKSEIHEAKILAAFIDIPEKVTEKQIEAWVKDFDSWDVCDMVCGNLFDQTPFAYNKAFELSKRSEEFVKRTGFVLMAALSVHDKKISDEKLIKFFPIIIREAEENRNFVKKAVNWALRQIGKRNSNLKKEALKTANIILKKYPDSKSANWVAKDAIRELISR